MRRAAPDAGFTLLEILVVTVVFGLLSVALWQGIGVGTRGWSRAEHGYGDEAAFQATEDTLRRLIGRADLSDSGINTGLSGDDARLRVLSWLPQGMGYDREVEVAIGVDSRQQLVLRWLRYRRADCAGAPDMPHQEILASHVRAVVFSYYGSLDGRARWRDSWTSEALPVLVRVRIVPETGAGWPAILIRPMLAVP